ncbi:MAG: beta-N-acetylhexosaminidase [Spirochaetaceae bacterium]|nr:MAG: beta-N-acetylhexosaminidase [Spirochaetaceae bacterium]
MHPQRLFLSILIIVLLAACQTQEKVELDSPAPEERPEVSIKPLPEETRGDGDRLGGISLPVYPEDGKPLPGAEDIVELVLQQLTLRQKIGQRFITGFTGRKVNNSVVSVIEQGYVGGFMLTRSNIQSRPQVKVLVDELQAVARAHNPPIGLFIAVDQEGGRVSRLDLDTLTRFPAPYYWGEYQDPLYVEAAAYIIGREVLALGCNLNFAPVLDLYGQPDDSIVGDRSMGTNPVQVGERGVYYLYGAQRAGIAAVVKHFPGHGRTTVDSHHQLPVVDIDEKTLLNEDLLPFQMAIHHGAEAIMTAHILYPRIDPDFPVTLSTIFLRGLLRERLGFDGVIISDDIEMGALRSRYSPQEIVRYALNAGVDILLEYGTLDVLKLIDEVHTMVETGEISAEAIDEGARRVLLLKWKYGLL